MPETERKSINPKLRKQVYERDNNSCQKCSKQEKLCLHHIIPVAEGQIDTPENLITLCERCHQEWEVIIYRRTNKITLEEWLEIPTALELILLFSKKKHWRDDMMATEVREGAILAFQMVKNLREVEGIE